MLGNNKKNGYRERIKHSQAKIVKGKLKEMSVIFKICIFTLFKIKQFIQFF